MLYIHIPFCKQKCSYCNFYFSTNFKLKNEVVSAIKKELFLRKEELGTKKIPSLYFGGGTPSVLDVGEIQSFIDEVQKYFEFQDDIEITLEANPDDLTQKFLSGLKSSEINRLSIGTQSFFDEDLRLMNRAHSAADAENSIKRAQDFGFENISIDLIYGSPVSDEGIWKENLQKAVALRVPHISSYALTVEPTTMLDNWVENGKVSAPDDHLQSEEFYYMSSFLEENGFSHYEISNFAKAGSESRHNSAYWQGRAYLGIGPAAHSFDGSFTRSINIANNALYIKNIFENCLPLEIERLSERDRFNELLMTGLRTKKGVEVAAVVALFSKDIQRYFQKAVGGKIDCGQLEICDGYLKIPKDRWFFADGIASDLFLV